MKKIFLRTLLTATAVLMVASTAVWQTGCSQTTTENADAPATRYQCPMHPDFTSERPGECSICGMDLVPIEASPASASASKAGTKTKGDGEREILYWVAPMDSSYRSDEPGKSPMGMDLVPVYKDEVEGGGSDVEGRATVNINTRQRQLIGVRTATANVTDTTRSMRSVGFVEPDQNRLRHIHTKVEGWLESVTVQAEGDPVKKGQVLYELYSPQLVSTQEELLAALRAERWSAVRAARDRLDFWNVAEVDVKAIERSGKAMRAVPFRSPISGYVHALDAIEGAFIKEMSPIYTLMNLDEIWVLGKFYQTDLPYLKVGTPANIEMPDGARLTGETRYVYPTVDPKTRFATVRFSFKNDGLRLRPGMYVDVAYKADLGPALVIPQDAVIRTGKRDIAFIALGDGRFEPRDLDLGAPVDEGYIVYSGIDDGEQVVNQANFFIDSESSLKASLQKFNEPPTEDAPKATPVDESGAASNDHDSMQSMPENEE